MPFQEMSFHGGPIMPVVHIVPIFWGEWSGVEHENRRLQMEVFLTSYAGYLSGAEAPPGHECVVKPYGVDGATVWPVTSVASKGRTTSNERNALSLIDALQSSHEPLPAASAVRLFVVLTRWHDVTAADGSRYGKWGAYHSHRDPRTPGEPPTLFAICPYPDDLPAPQITRDWQTRVAHEILEAATNPLASGGWLGPGGEGVDICGGEFTQFGWGAIPPFPDSQSRSCAIHTRCEMPNVDAVGRGSDHYDVVVRGPDGQVYHRSLVCGIRVLMSRTGRSVRWPVVRAWCRCPRAVWICSFAVPMGSCAPDTMRETGAISSSLAGSRSLAASMSWPCRTIESSCWPKDLTAYPARIGSTTGDGPDGATLGPRVRL